MARTWRNPLICPAAKFPLDHFDTLVTFVQKLPGRIASAASGMWDGIKDSFRHAINWIIDKWNDLSFTVGGGTVFGKDLPSFTLSTPDTRPSCRWAAVAA